MSSQYFPPENGPPGRSVGGTVDGRFMTWERDEKMGGVLIPYDEAVRDPDDDRVTHQLRVSEPGRDKLLQDWEWRYEEDPEPIPTAIR